MNTYDIVPVTLIITTEGEITETECSDDQAMAWAIYATDPRDGDRKRVLMAASQQIAEATVACIDPESDVW